MRVIQIASLALLWLWTGVQLTTAALCADQVSSGDKAVGIWGEDSPSCPSGGGVGCFGGTSTCRFCKSFSTPQSAHLDACATTTAASTPTVTAAPTTAPSTTAPPTAAPTPAPTVATTANTSDDDCPGSLPVA
ncbi:hypothetical protein PHYSODRAFT_334395 [Phytophthora sojae]|uniref:Uncharacterized protein n=1 Tax=Phytophthora sojae (strain P6497) TaxID=1094619 RepID=G4ZKN0_PHYSP|nr:hypothetical protein PHYSODRAFT_334395 [Phytophthora sojae]EGZ16211.1 hypothetical protein PHYSODRAFT_334395 [Phytophthora sojae]|eukprot:XP_009529960.1 hypothetical protein PHYSODRAFT_334395 [Phytophthora sojae]